MQSLLTWLKRPWVATAICVAALLLLPFTLFLSVTFGNNTQLPVDNLFQYQPFRASAAQFGITQPQNALLDDLILENFQWKHHTIEALKAGQLPLWNPHLFAGVPFLAAGQHSMLYPLSALYLLLPLPAAYGWFTVLQLGLAGVFLFIFMRALGLRRLSALFAGVVWQLSGFMLVSVVFPMIVAATAWLPLILAMCEKVIQQSPALGNRPSSMPWVVIGAFAIAMMVLAGHVEIIVYTALVAVFYSIWRISTVIGFRNLKVDGRYLAARVAWLGVMGIAGLMLAAIQLIPLFELVTRNFRGAGNSTFEQVLSYGFPIRNALLWLMPNIFGTQSHHFYFDLFSFSMQPANGQSGNTWWGIKDNVEAGVYVGLITLLLAGMTVANAIKSAVKRQTSNVKARTTFPIWFFITLSIASILFIFGTVFYAVLYFGLPGISQLHSPFRWKIPLTLCLAALAGFGLDALLTEARAAKARLTGMRLPTAPVQFSRFTLLAPFVGMGIGLLAIIGVIVIRIAWGAFQPMFANALNGELVQRAFSTPEALFSYTAGNVLLFGALLLASCFVWWLLMQRRRNTSDTASPLLRFAPVMAIALLVIDMNIGFVGFNPSVDPKLLLFTPEAIQFLQQDTTPHRITAYEPAGSNAFKPLNMNMGWRYGFEDIRGYDSIIPKQYTDYMTAIEPQGDLLYNRVGPIRNPQSLDSPLLDLLGTKYVIAEAQTPITSAGYKEVFNDGATAIYENTRAMPRAFTLPLNSTVVYTDFAQAIQTIDPTQHVMIDAKNNAGFNSANVSSPVAAKAAPANITSYGINEVWVDVVITQPAWLVLADSDFPGWRAYVRPKGNPDSDEEEHTIVKVNGNFRGILFARDLPTESGQPPVYTVRFKYSPQSFQVGGFSTFLALIGLLFLAGVYLWRNWPRNVNVAGMNRASAVRLVAKNSAILTGLNIVARLIDFVFALLMLRILGPVGAGNYYFAVVIVGWFEILMNFGLNTFLTREISRDKGHATTYLAQTSRLRMLLAAGIAPVLIAIVVLWRQFGDLPLEAEIAIILLAISQVPSSLATGLTGLFYAYEKAEVPASLTIISALLKAGLGAVLLIAGLGVIGLGITSIAVNTITLVILLVAAGKLLRHQPKAEGEPRHTSNRAVMRESYPLMMNHLLATLFFKVDVPMLQAMKGPAVVGYYSTAYKFIDAFNIIPSFFTQSLFPAMSRMALQRDETLSRSYVLALKLLVMVSLPLAVFTSFMAEPMIAVLGGREFLPAGAIALGIMCWSMPIGWINSVTNYALIAANQQHALTRAFVIGLTFNVVANLLLIPTFSFVAAAVVTIFSEIVEGAAFYVYVRRHIAPVNWVDVLARPFLAAGVMALFAAVFMQAGLLLVGLALGGVAYAGVLWVTRVLSTQEREILRPLVKRGA
jgi:O-antigen/teichoic acid export membrane protein